MSLPFFCVKLYIKLIWDWAYNTANSNSNSTNQIADAFQVADIFQLISRAFKQVEQKQNEKQGKHMRYCARVLCDNKHKNLVWYNKSCIK